MALLLGAIGMPESPAGWVALQLFVIGLPAEWHRTRLPTGRVDASPGATAFAEGTAWALLAAAAAFLLSVSLASRGGGAPVPSADPFAEEGLPMLLLLWAVLPALCEEPLFRGILLEASKGLGPAGAIALNGTVFSLFHLPFGGPSRLLPTFLLGCLLAWQVLRWRSLRLARWIHFCYNGAALLLHGILRGG